jgi:predicted N-acetyltransferase YhbS
MPHTEYVKATENDLHDLVDFLDYVFSRAYNPNNFELMLPGLFTQRNFMTGTNYLVKENGKIVANVGVYPADYNVNGDIIRVAGVTSVAVHPRSRSKGYMRTLMDEALGDMRKNGIQLAFLIGQRQRYEYFGFTPCGIKYRYTCNTTNIKHFFKDGFAADISLKEPGADDTAVFDDIFHIHNAEPVHMIRPRERFADIMATWENKTVAVYQGETIVGYFSVNKDCDTIYELRLKDTALLGAVINAYLTEYDQYEVTVEVYPHEVLYVSGFAAFAESMTANHALNFNVLDYPAVLSAFLKLKCGVFPLSDYETTVAVENHGTFTVTVANNRPSVSVTDKKPDAVYTHTEAMQAFFSIEGSAKPYGAVPLFVNQLDQS